MVMNAISAGMGILSSLLGGGSDSAMLSYENSKKLQQHQYELNRKTRQTAFQDTRESLENAGYNPLLAVGQQAQGGTFGASLNVQDPKTENMQNFIGLMNGLSQAKLNSAQAYNQKMQGQLTTQQKYNLITQGQLNSAQAGLVNLQQNRQQIENLHLPDKIKSEIKLNNDTATANMINAQANMENASANQMNAQSNRMNAITNKEVGASQAYHNYNKSLGYTTSASIGPFHISHTGNPNLYTIGTNNKAGNTKTETINGKKVKVKTLR